MEKRAIVAIVLSLAVWFLWMYFMKPKTTEKKVQEKKTEVVEEKAKGNEIDVVEKKRPMVTRSIVVKPSRVKEELEIPFKTSKYTITLSNRGGSIISLKYAQRDIELIVDKNKFNANGYINFNIYFRENEFLEASPLDNVLWSYRKAGNNKIVFSTALTINNSPLVIEKTYSFVEDCHCFHVELKIINPSRTDIVFPNNYIIVSPSDFIGPDMDYDNSYNQLNSIYYLNGDFEKPSKGGGFFSKSGIVQKETGVTQWVGVMSRYFLLIAIPENFTGTGALYDNREETGFKTGMFISADSLQARKELVKSFKVYIGEKNKDKLAAVDKSIVDAADISTWIEPIRDFLLWCLLKINILIGNLGWSLVIFSIITKILFLPLTQKSTESMKKMQALNPKITEIRGKYKDKPELMNKKIMELYKKEKVNPASGCLPMLLQLPFFFALYSALINSVDLWQAPFTLWITDLSLPDTVFQISGFNINILPIIMTGSTYLQQKMSSGDAAGQQQKMMAFLPLIFIVIFWNMPSGLVLYWTMQNILQIFHQLYINKRGSDKESKT